MLKRFLNKRVDKDWLHTNFPCMTACPAHTNAGRYVALIAEGRYEEAYRISREPNPMASICGRVCAHPCETACRRGEIDAPIQIRALKRFLTERHGPESKNPINVNPSPAGWAKGRKVAVIGAGPVGLSAAHDLALMGYTITIFDAAPVPGGMLYLGIPEYRLPRNVIEAQVREIMATGDITLKLNHAAGRDFEIGNLREQGFDAVLIAVGAQRSRELSIPGVDLDGVHKGIDFLLNVNLGYQFTIGKKVVVIGGGNVAMDVARSAAREVLRQHETTEVTPSDASVVAEATHAMVDISLSALRMGASEVHIVCLEGRDEMPADLFEIEEAETEGIVLHPGLGPKAILGSNGRVSGLQTLQIKSLRDEQGRFNPSYIEGSESILECDTVIMAIGQTPKLEFLRPGDNVQVSSRGLIVADPLNLMTTSPGIFAGGDCVFGPRLIIDSVADGKRAAVGIDEFLRGQPHPEPVIEVELLPHYKRLPEYMSLSREPVPMLPLDRRTGVTEVEIGYDEEAAQREASRCLQCWINTVMEGSEADGTECVLCGGCVDVCPEDCFTLAPLESLELPEPVLAHLRANEELYQYEMDDVRMEELGKITGSVMIKDETRCIRCGLCALRCPVGTITMESYSVRSAEMTGLVPIQAFDIDRTAKNPGR